MKKTIITIMLAIISMATFAQKEPGTLTFYPRVGVNFSTFSDGRIYHLDESYTESEFKPGLVIGAELEYQLNNLFAIEGKPLPPPRSVLRIQEPQSRPPLQPRTHKCLGLCKFHRKEPHHYDHPRIWSGALKHRRCDTYYMYRTFSVIIYWSYL